MCNDSASEVVRPLRPYQTEFVGRINAAIDAGHRRVLAVAPTGGGKTVIAASLIHQHRDRNVLFLVHRRELVKQTTEKLQAIGIEPGVILPGRQQHPDRKCQIAMVQTLSARAIRRSIMALPPADVIFVDEAHHIRASTYEVIVSAYPDAVVIGLTATPCRSDGRGLGPAFDVMVESASVEELIEARFLVPTKVYAPHSPNLAGVKSKAGDYNEKQLAGRMDRPELVGDIVATWLKFGGRRKTVVFATGVAHSKHIRDEFIAAGVRAAHIDGRTPTEEREKILGEFAAGDLEIICNALVLTEGWDVPAVGCLVLGRPTKSLGLYRQIVGRVLRPSPGKTNAIILDHAGSTCALGFAEDHIAWALADDFSASNESAKARASADAELVPCPECSAVMTKNRECGECGWSAMKQRAAVAAGQLAELARSAPTAANDDDARSRDIFFRQLQWLGAANPRYRPGFAAAKYRERFGVWPRPASGPPIPACDSVRAWVHQSTINWARSQHSGGRR